jgi:phospholipid/cholesterol/gamma-HCH transport system substrate-binding protein
MNLEETNDVTAATQDVLAHHLECFGKLDLGITYRNDLEQLLVLLPPGIAILQGAGLANRNTKQAYKGGYLSFNLNLNLPPACTTGFLPPQQQRVPTDVDYPPRPPGNVYCRVPQDAPFNVRGARNIPCETKARQTRTDRRDVQKRRELRPAQRRLPLEGDPNATTSGQAIPQLPPGTPGSTALPPAPLAVAEYDPATGTYVGPDGKTYTQANLARDANQHQTWQDMLSPPKGH